MSWNVPDTPAVRNCQQLSLVVVQRSSLDEQNTVPKPSAEFGLATWWVNIGASTADTLAGCPSNVGGGGT